jgi:ParB/RepB/Spo0J family partition protein
MSSATSVQPQSVSRFVPIARLAESPTNPRKHFDQKKLAELAASVKENGVLEPLLVRELTDAAGLEIVCGARRYRAAKLAGLTEVPAVVRAVSDQDVRVIQLAENGCREDLSPIEEAETYAALLEEGFTLDGIAKRLGKEKRHIARRIPLAKLPKKVKDALSAGYLPVAHAELIGVIPDAKLQEIALGRILSTAFAGETTVVTARPYAVAKRIVEEEFMTSLSAAIFDPEDASLSPLGPCSACPHLTGNNPDLFGEVGGKSVCTNPKDFQLKSENHLKKLRDSGYTVLLSANQLKRAFPYGGNSDQVGKEFVDLERICDDDPKRRTYEALLGKAEKLKTVFALKNGRVRKLYPAKDIRAALVAAGHAFAKEKPKMRPRGNAAASRSQAQLERIGDDAVARELAKKLRSVKLAPSGWTDLFLLIVLVAEDWRVKAVIGRHGYDGSDKDFAEHREKIIAERFEAMTDGEKRSFLIDLLAGDWFHSADKAEAEVYKHLLKLAGVDYVRVANAAIDAAKKAAVEAKQTSKPAIAAKTARANH